MMRKACQDFCEGIRIMQKHWQDFGEAFRIMPTGSLKLSQLIHLLGENPSK
jgi:hypothetical protein